MNVIPKTNINQLPISISDNTKPDSFRNQFFLEFLFFWNLIKSVRYRLCVLYKKKIIILESIQSIPILNYFFKTYLEIAIFLLSSFNKRFTHANLHQLWSFITIFAFARKTSRYVLTLAITTNSVHNTAFIDIWT